MPAGARDNGASTSGAARASATGNKSTRTSTTGSSAGVRSSASKSSLLPGLEGAQRMAKGKSMRVRAEDKDPDQLIHEFDDKLAEINGMLAQYKAESADASGARGGSPSRQQRSSPKRPMTAGSAGGRGSGVGGGTSRDKGAARQMTEAEAYMSSKIQRRVKSAGPGASRALSERLELYRTDPMAQAQLKERCQQHAKAIAEEEAKRRAAGVGDHNFVAANIRGLSADPEPYVSKVLTLTGSQSMNSNMQGPRSASPPSGLAPRSAWQSSNGRPSSGRFEGGASRGHPSPPNGQPTDFGLSLFSRMSTTSGISRHQGAAGGVHFAESPIMAMGGFHSYFRPVPPPPGSVAESSLRIAPSREFAFHGYFSSANGPMPDLKSVASARHHSRPHSAASNARPVVGFSAAGPTASMRRSAFASSRALSGLSVATRHSARSMTGNGLQEGDGEDGEDYEDDDQDPPSESPHDGEVVRAMREMRLSLSARPASGGSPTRRTAFLQPHRMLSSRRMEHAQVVKQRRDEFEDYKRNRKEYEAELRARRESEEAAAREAQQKLVELMQRHRAWLGITNLAHKLWFTVQAIKADRQVRPIRMLRKEAALTIATWYKHILLRRRERELVELISRLRRVMRPYVVAKREVVRQRAAARILHFLQFTTSGSAVTAQVAVGNFKSKMIQLQRRWKTMVMVRQMQRQIVYNSLVKFERALVKKNQRSARYAEEAEKARSKSGRKSTTGAAAPALPASPGGWGPTREMESPPSSPHHLQHTSSRSPSPSRGHRASAWGPDSPPPPHGGPPSPGGLSTKGASVATFRRGTELVDPELEAELSKHKEMLPKDVRQEVVEEGLRDVRRRFYKQLEAYRNEMSVYRAQLPIEELRLKLLRDAGLDAQPQLVEPARPRMTALMTRPQLKRLLQAGIHAVAARKAAAMQARREAAEAEWLLKQAQKHGLATAGVTTGPASGSTPKS